MLDMIEENISRNWMLSPKLCLIVTYDVDLFFWTCVNIVNLATFVTPVQIKNWTFWYNMKPFLCHHIQELHTFIMVRFLVHPVHSMISFYQPFRTHSGTSAGSSQRYFHISFESVAVAGQVPDLIVHYTITFVVYDDGSRHSCNTHAKCSFAHSTHSVSGHYMYREGQQ